MPMNDLISPIPSGLENKRFRNNGKVKNFQLVKEKNLKTRNILCSFNVHTNYSERKYLKDIIQSNQDFDIKNFR